MTEQITLEEALELVKFRQDSIDGKWYVHTVKGECYFVEGDCRIVKGDCIAVKGKVHDTINGREWQYVENPEEKMLRLIDEGSDYEGLLEACKDYYGYVNPHRTFH